MIAVRAGQTLVDIAMQELGDASRLMELARLNNINPSDPLVPGTVLNVPVIDPAKDFVKRILSRTKPASTKPQGFSVPEGTGIGFWRIGENFIVS